MSDVTSFETSFEARRQASAQRLEVVSDLVGRRRWTPEAKARILAETLAPGANVAEVARRHAIVPQQLYRWRNALQSNAGDMSFVPAVVDQAVPPPTPALAPHGEIIIEIGDIKIRVPDGVSADHIERVLLAVRVSA